MKAKRIISCILMLLMLASLMPAGFAATSGPYNPNPNPDPGNSYVVPDDNSQQPSAGDNGNSSAHTHNWQNLKTELEATCTSYGMATQACYDCGATQTVYTNMLPHSWGEWEITARATDHTAGERQRTCEVCCKTESEKYYLEGTVLPGSSGEEVEELQDLLNENGIPAPKDGEYGDATREAVREAQRRNGLEVDGIAWLQTVNHLQHRWGDWEVLREPTLTKPGLQHRICEICGYDEKEEFIDGLGPGARGDFVRDLQEILAALGYYDGRIDGDYGDGVRQAVERWQRDHGMEPTGIVDRDILNQIIEEYLDFIRQQKQGDEEEPEELEDEDEPPEDDGKDEDEFEKSTSEIPDETKNKALGVTAPKKAAAKLEFTGEGVYKDETGAIKRQYYLDVEQFKPGDEIQWTLFLINTGDVNIKSASGGFLGQKNYAHNNISQFNCGIVKPGCEEHWVNREYRESSITTTYMGGTHKITSEDLEHGEFADFAFANVNFENGESVHLEAEIHFPVGGDSSVSATFRVQSLTEPENGLFYTEGEKVNYIFVLKNTCSTGLNYIGYAASSGIQADDILAHEHFTYKPAKGYLEPQKDEKFVLLQFTLPHTVTAGECSYGTYNGTGAIARCTFDNSARRTYLAYPEFPCGIEDPSASLEIKETSAKNNGEYYTPGETITYDFVLTNTGNIILEYVSLKSKEGGALLSFGTQNLMPGESVTIHSDSKKVTAEMVKAGNTIDVTGYADCVFKSAKGNANADASDTKSFPIGGKPSAKLELRELSKPEKPFYTEGEMIVIGATLTNDGDIDLNSATITASYDGGEAEFVANAGTLAPGESTIEFTALHTVTKEEAQAKKIECTVSADNCSFADGTVLPVSETISFDTGDPALKVDIVVSSTAPDGFYKRNEAIDYQITLSNIGNMDFAHVNTLILLPGLSKGYAYVIEADGFAAGASVTEPYTHTVTMEDVAAGTVTADAEALGLLEDGTEISASASVTSETGMLPVDLSIEKIVTSTSTYSFYEENDTITYLITVTNNGKEAIPSVEVSDTSPAGATALDIITEMAPGASISYPYTYTVTGADVSTGNVHNRADLGAVLPDGSWYTASAEVDSATGKYVPPTEGGDDDGGTGPVVWYLHETVTDGVSTKALDQGIEMSITLYEDGRAEIEINKEITPAFWTENEEAITVTAEEKENLYTKVEDTLENDQEGTLMIFRREKPEPSKAE